LIVVATSYKLEEVDSLLVDTGDSEVDRELSGGDR
jgi:predicted polyphosphate/ATP-dependent NAD kinase